MSYAMPADASLDALIDHTTSVIAALQATDEFADLAPQWLDLRNVLLGHRLHRDELRWTLLGAQRKVDYRDALWDAAVVELSGRAFLAAGKSADARPYADLFGTLPARELKSLGPARAAAAAELILAKAAVLNSPELGASAAAVAKATEKLKAADVDRAAARKSVLVLDITRAEQVDALELAMAHTEVQILTKMPGRNDLVRALLAPARKESAAKAEAAAPVAVGP